MSTSYGRLEKTVNTVLLWSGHVLGRHFKNRLISECRNGRQVSERTLKKILRSGRNSELGERYGFREISDADDYRRAVPLTTYDDYRPYIRRMKEGGEQHLLTDKRIAMLAQTSGTAAGEKKLVPVSAEAAVGFFRVTCIIAHNLHVAMKKRGLKRSYGKGLLLTDVNPKRNNGGNEVSTGNITGFSIDAMRLIIPVLAAIPPEALANPDLKDTKYIKARYALADPDLVYMGGIYMSAVTDMMSYIINNHEMLIKDIETGRIDPSIEMTDEVRRTLESRLEPDPVRAAELRRVFSEPSHEGLLNRIWKDMSFVCAIGMGDFKPFTRTMKGYSDPDTYYNYLAFGASESFVGQAIGLDDTRFLLFPDIGFFEFIPAEGEQGRPLLMDELEPGSLYEVVVTNKYGLYRYMLRDVIRVVGYEGEVPYFEFAYRANHVTDIGGVHITGEDLSLAVEKFSADEGLSVRDYCLYANTKEEHPHVELFIETDRELGKSDIGRISETFERDLQESCFLYAEHRGKGDVASSVVIPVKSGTFMEYRERQFSRGASPNQLKALRLIDTEERYDFFMSHTAD